MIRSRPSSHTGFTLIETLIAVAVFLIISTSSYQGYIAILKGVQVVRIKQSSLSVANEQIEIIHNLPYVDVGIVGGLPLGKIPHEQSIFNDGIEFLVTTTIRNIDLPFDGVIGGVPNDSSPADNKLVEIEVACVTCSVEPIRLTTQIAPLSLETTGENGALFVQVFNANGLPISGAEVHIENNKLETPLIIDDITNANGLLQLIDAPTGTEAYEITVTKDGYSVEKTYANNDPENPVPDRLHSNVVTGQVTQVSFSIDELSDLQVYSKRDTCSPVGLVDFQLTGSKMIGLNTFKYDQSQVTNGSGYLSLPDLEWDNYTFDVTDSTYSLAGSNPMVLLNLAPGSSQEVDLIVAPSNPNMLLVRVKDGATGLPLSDARVIVDLGGDDEELLTGRGFLTQTDWSGGSSQDDFNNETRYFSQDGNLETLNPAGEIKLVDVGGNYVSNGELISSTFDSGTTTNFQILDWIPGDQPVGAGADPVRFQVATNLVNNASSTWSFVGPLGTSNSYFTSPGQSFDDIHSGDRYLRYKALLSTASSTNTPSISDISFTFSSDCTPAGQVFFTGLSTGSYTVTVEKSGYTTSIQEDFPISNLWQYIDITLTP